MSWIITHQCRFQSRTHQQYCVNVSKQADTSVEVKQLIGAETPFSTSEASGDDIFTPVRPQTGYLRVLDNSGGTLLEDLLPENNTQKMVTLVNLTTGKTEWIGFMAAEVFTQPWDNDMTELEFPLRSALKCLEDVTIQTGVTGTNRLALLVYNAITSLFGEGQVPFTQLVFMDDFKNACTHMIMRANFSKFFSSETIMNDNTETVIRVGQTYKNAIEAMCQVFGITLREQGTTLIFGHYDNGGDFTVNVNTMDWSVLALISNSTSLPDIQPQGGIITKDILPIADFRSKNNKLSFIQGGREAIVTLNVDAQSLNVLQIPQSEIKSGGVKDIHSIVIQLEKSPNYSFSPDFVVKEYFKSPNCISLQRDDRTGSNTNEVFEYYKCATSGAFKAQTGRGITRQHNGWQNSNREECFYVSVFGNMFTENTLPNIGLLWPLIYYTWYVTEVRTGAIPCRWSTNGETLKNGLLIIQDVWRSGDTGEYSAYGLYSIWSQNANNLQTGYININFEMEMLNTTYLSYQAASSIGTFHWERELNMVYQWNGASGASVEFNMPCMLHVQSGSTNLYWNSSGWQNSPAGFHIVIKDGRIKSNKTANMNIEEDGGWFIPSPNIEDAYVEFKILNRVQCDSSVELEYSDGTKDYAPIYPFQKILTSLNIGVVYPRNITSSNRSSNVYRKTILDSGFSDDKEKDLTFGTYNQNFPSPAFLRNSANTAYIQNVEYIGADGSTVRERPEMHLLNRMVEQYKTMRRTMTAKIATGIDLFRQRFAYNGRLFMAIDKKHDWEREEQEVKFIEVN